MESRFDMTNFEQTLREQADQFSMIPSGRVWNGIYNSLHPGSKWPSVSMLLFFMLALVGIGPLNNNPSNNLMTVSTGNSGLSLEEDRSAAIFKIKHYILSDNSLSKNTNIEEPGRIVSLKTYLAEKTLLSRTLPENQEFSTTLTLKNSEVNKKAEETPLIKENELISSVNTPVNSISEVSKKAQEGKKVFDKEELKLPAIQQSVFQEKETGFDNNVHELSTNTGADKITSKATLLSMPFEPLIFIQTEEMELFSLNEEMKAETETAKVTALHKKRNKKVSWIFYVSPSISSVYFSGKPLQDKNPRHSNQSPLVINPNQAGNEMRYNARAGLNIGTEMNYAVAERWKLLSGIQLSYSGYNILSHKVHPSFAELILKDGPYSTRTNRYITYYGSGEGQDEITLHNNSFQLSLPIGTKYSVWKNKNVEINVFASVEPVLIVTSHAYMLSSDGRNYVNDQDLLRRANVSGQLGSSISFSGEKVKWHIGPMFRYQILSSYKNLYPINEHLVDYGIKIGISK